MLVILRENIRTLGNIGDVVTVSDGYARNFLLPRNLVVAANEKNMAVIEHHKKTLEKKRAVVRAASEELAKKLADFSCTLHRKVGENDKLFGSVTSHDIADALKAGGFKIEKTEIRMDQPIKALGVHSVTVELDGGVSASVKVWVRKEE